jgi:hypothetical protein
LTLPFSDDFESGDFTAWTAVVGSPTVQTTVKHHGNNAAKFEGTGTQFAEFGYPAISYPTYLLHARGTFYFSTLPSSGNHVRIFQIGDSAQVITDIINDGGTLKWRLTSPAGESTVLSPNPAVNTWYSVELKAQYSGGNVYAELWVNGSSVASNSTGSAAASFHWVYIGAWEKSEALTSYLDCVVIADAYIGPEVSSMLQTVVDSFGLSDASYRNKPSMNVADAVGISDVTLRNKTLTIADVVMASQDSIAGDKTLSLFDSIVFSDLTRALKTLKVTDEAALADETLIPFRTVKIDDEVTVAEVAYVGEGGARKTKLFLMLGDLALQIAGD